MIGHIDVSGIRRSTIHTFRRGRESAQSICEGSMLRAHEVIQNVVFFVDITENEGHRNLQIQVHIKEVCFSTVDN